MPTGAIYITSLLQIDQKHEAEGDTQLPGGIKQELEGDI
jgi:hypothetical protein